MLKKQLITAAVAQPVDRAAIKLQCRIDEDNTAHDAMIDALIVSATSFAEKIMDRHIMPQQWACYVDAFTSQWLVLPCGLVRSIAVDYIDADNQVQSVALNTVKQDLIGDVSRIQLTESFTCKAMPNAVMITMQTGYEGLAQVPEPIKQAITLLVCHWYENPTGVAAVQLHEVPASFTALLDAYKVYR